MTEKITSNQENRLCDLFREGLRALGLGKDEAQEIIKVGGKMQDRIKPILRELAKVDRRFGSVIAEFEFIVPADYMHDSQIDNFVKNQKKTTHNYFSRGWTSADFAKATYKLVPGKTYIVKIISVLTLVSSKECLDFLAKQNAILVGGQGLTLLSENYAYKFPIEKWTVSLDKEDALYEGSDGDRWMPRACASVDDSISFMLGSFENYLSDDSCLLCFYDK